MPGVVCKFYYHMKSTVSYAWCCMQVLLSYEVNSFPIYSFLYIKKNKQKMMSNINQNIS